MKNFNVKTNKPMIWQQWKKQTKTVELGQCTTELIF
jgi:hypothetical protein